MKMTDLSARRRRTTSSTRSDGLAGSAAVISSSSSTSGSRCRCARKVDNRSKASGGAARGSTDRVPEAELLASSERLDRRIGQAQVVTNIQIGNDRRLLIDRQGSIAACPVGECAARWWPRTTIRPVSGFDDAGQDLDQGALAGAIRAHQGVDFVGRTAGEARFKATTCAVRLRDVRRLEQQIGPCRGSSVLALRVGGGDGAGQAGVHRPEVARGFTAPEQERPGPCSDRRFVQIGIGTGSAAEGLMPGTEVHTVQVRLALISGVVQGLRVEQNGVQGGRGGRRWMTLPGRRLVGHVDARAADWLPCFVTAAPTGLG